MNDYFNEYLNYFFDENIEVKDTIKKDLIGILNSKIAETKCIELSAKNILRFIKCCGELLIEPIKLKSLNIIKEKQLGEIYYISNDFIQNKFNQNKKIMISIILLEIYFIYDKDKLLEMIGDDEFCKLFLKLLHQKKFININQNDKDKILKIQKSLFRVAKNLDDAQIIINFQKRIESSLNAILDNFDSIISLKEKEIKPFNGFKWNMPAKDDNINKIFIKYNSINNKLISQQKKYSLLKIEDIFDQMVDIYINKNNLEEYLLLKDFIDDKNQKIEPNTFVKYYNKIHDTGMRLIKDNKMTAEQIIKFIKNQDIYYSNSKQYYGSFKRDPEIFSYLKITDKKNIQLIKDNKLYKLYDKSSFEMKVRFSLEITKQVKTFNDMDYVFEIFSDDYITDSKNALLYFINDKLKKIINKIDRNNCIYHTQ